MLAAQVWLYSMALFSFVYSIRMMLFRQESWFLPAAAAMGPQVPDEFIR
jgi:hypothetical protein